tara:strand:- start:3126 stop:4040 length:915 start_codon:yes stop_codon:yes gene_type:complete
MVFFTVITPTYNRINYLKQSIKSVRNQHFKDWNLHIIDNSSNDGTLDYLQDIVKEDNRIKFDVVNNNGIIAYSRNYGLNQANSNAVSFLDDDDIWHQNKLEDDYSILSNKEGLVYSKSYSFFENKNIIGTLPSRKVSIYNPIFDLLHYGNIFTTSTVSYSLNKLTKSLRFNESSNVKTWEDYELWLRLIMQGKLTPFYINKYNTKYRISNSQTSSHKQDIENNKNISKFFKKYFQIHNVMRISKQPLWAHYNNMISYFFLNYYWKSFLSFLNTLIISLLTLNFVFLIKALLKFGNIYLNYFIKR